MESFFLANRALPGNLVTAASNLTVRYALVATADALEIIRFHARVMRGRIAEQLDHGALSRLHREHLKVQCFSPGDQKGGSCCVRCIPVGLRVSGDGHCQLDQPVKSGEDRDGGPTGGNLSGNDVGCDYKKCRESDDALLACG